MFIGIYDHSKEPVNTQDIWKALKQWKSISLSAIFVFYHEFLYMYFQVSDENN